MKRHFDEKFGPYLDGKLSAEERESLESEMQTDPEVAREFASYRRARAAEQAIGGERYRTGANFTAQVMARITEKETSGLAFWWPRFFFSPHAAWGASALVALIVVALTLKISPRQYRSGEVYEATIISEKTAKDETSPPAPAAPAIREQPPAEQLLRGLAEEEPSDHKGDEEASQEAAGVMKRKEVLKSADDRDMREREPAAVRQAPAGETSVLRDPAFKQGMAAESMDAATIAQAENEAGGAVIRTPISITYRLFPSKIISGEQILIVHLETGAGDEIRGSFTANFAPADARTRTFGSVEWQGAKSPSPLRFEIPAQAASRIRELIYFIKTSSGTLHPQFKMNVDEPAAFAARHDWQFTQERSPAGLVEELALRASELELHPESAEVGWDVLKKIVESDPNTPPALSRRIRAQSAAAN